MSRALMTAVLIAGATIAAVQAQNRVPNPEFDVDTTGWSGVEMGSGDHDGCTNSGSGVGSGLAAQHLSSCFSLSPGEFLESSFWYRGQGSSTLAALLMYPFADCTGDGGAVVLSVPSGSASEWRFSGVTFTVPGGLLSGRLVAQWFSIPGPVSLDGAYVGIPRISGNGFEEGSTCRWSVTWPKEMTVLLPGNVPLTLVRIPAGTFMMGSPESEPGRYTDESLHVVTLSQAYWLTKYEVTQAQWQAVMGTAMPTACGDYGVGPDYPVYCVSWDDIAGANGFVETLNTYLGTTLFRLPTEAEWERAARGGTSTRFSHGDVLECDDFCGACAAHDPYMVWCGNDLMRAEPVGSRFANPLGLHDIHGNIWEWVQDWYGTYVAGPVTDPTGAASGTSRVVRGGYWSYNAKYCRSATRFFNAPTYRSQYAGFRLARSQ